MFSESTRNWRSNYESRTHASTNYKLLLIRLTSFYQSNHRPALNPLGAHVIAEVLWRTTDLSNILYRSNILEANFGVGKELSEDWPRKGAVGVRWVGDKAPTRRRTTEGLLHDIIFEGKIIGAMGVSGNIPQQDEDIAKV